LIPRIVSLRIQGGEIDEFHRPVGKKGKFASRIPFIGSLFKINDEIAEF
jgi:hypothetical protein